MWNQIDAETLRVDAVNRQRYPIDTHRAFDRDEAHQRTRHFELPDLRARLFADLAHHCGGIHVTADKMPTQTRAG